MIDSDGKLEEFLPQLRSADWVALDTEADSLHAYPEKLCLIQISITVGDFLIDPLSPISLSELWTELKKHQILMHGADYDLRLLRKGHNFVPTRIFDTMLASRLLGEREFGLINLTRKYLNVTLEKGSQKADWAKRPLTPRMEAYARNDTHYLKPLSDILKGQLCEKNRLSWAEQCCDRLVTECAIAVKPEPDLVWRVRGANKLPPRSLAVLREIWHWREQEALGGNRPPYFVLSHEAMIAVASAAADHSDIDSFLPRHFSSRRRDGLLEAIAKGLALAPENHPEPMRFISRRQTEAERQRFLVLERIRNHRATELALDPTLIASRATLLALANDWETNKADLMEWQRELLSSAKG